MYLVRTLFIILGSISLALGILGIFLPVLPTTPFLLLTAYLYLKSSPKAYNWLVSHKRLGPYIINYQEKKVIPRRVKVYALSLMWASILLCILVWVDILWLKIGLLAVAVGVTIHILSFKSEE
ncbi:YbaN family protein [Bacteroidales bacterium OttesenSCG-928-L03]|nr:YbaN family protein [Bacteroidales bacterium OttesenSCG-928-L03]